MHDDQIAIDILGDQFKNTERPDRSCNPQPVGFEMTALVRRFTDRRYLKPLQRLLDAKDTLRRCDLPDVGRYAAGQRLQQHMFAILYKAKFGKKTGDKGCEKSLIFMQRMRLLRHFLRPANASSSGRRCTSMARVISATLPVWSAASVSSCSPITTSTSSISAK